MPMNFKLIMDMSDKYMKVMQDGLNASGDTVTVEIAKAAALGVILCYHNQLRVTLKTHGIDIGELLTEDYPTELLELGLSLDNPLRN